MYIRGDAALRGERIDWEQYDVNGRTELHGFVGGNSTLIAVAAARTRLGAYVRAWLIETRLRRRDPRCRQ